MDDNTQLGRRQKLFWINSDFFRLISLCSICAAELKMTEKGTWNPPNVTSVSDQMLFQKLGCNRDFFFLYKHAQTWSTWVFNKAATVSAPPTELHRSTALLHHILFWKHRPHCNTAEALGGGGGEWMAHYADDRAWVKEDIWASVVYLSGNLCLNERF